MDLLRVLLALGLPHCFLAFTWIDDPKDNGYNCLGKVVDAICCKDSYCKATSETECKEGNKQFLCSWTGSKCISFRDDQNNVCCKSGTADACAKVVQGICPDNWQVPNGCCSPEASKYNGTLLGVKPGYTCCNAPCAEMTKAGCPLPDACAPKARAYVQQGNFNYNLGFYRSPLNYAQNALTGRIIPGFGLGSQGFRGDYATSTLDSLGYGSSKDSQVDEITVDDLMNLLIESLADDKDAMVYNSELTSDPFLGKTKSGGSLASMNLPNPNIFLDRIYGSPFGLSQGQIGNYPSLVSPYDSMYGGYGAGAFGYGYPGIPQSYPMQYQQFPQYGGQNLYPQSALQYGFQQPQQPYPGQTSPQQYLAPPQSQLPQQYIPPPQSQQPQQYMPAPQYQPPYFAPQQPNPVSPQQSPTQPQLMQGPSALSQKSQAPGSVPQPGFTAQQSPQVQPSSPNPSSQQGPIYSKP